MTYLALGALVAGSAAACAGRSTPGGRADSASSGAEPPAAGATTPSVGDAAATSAPRLDRIAPDTIALGRGEVPTLVLTGTGFVPGPQGGFATGANEVRVGRASVQGVGADSSGTSLRFALPLSYTDTTSKGRPSSFSPGSYPVSVVTPRGTSNTLTLTMIP